LLCSLSLSLSMQAKSQTSADAMLERIESEQRALEAAAAYTAVGQLAGEEDDIGTKVKWPRQDAKQNRIRVLRGGRHGVGRHVPVCVRPGIVVEQRTLSRLDAVRKRAEIREVLALGQRLTVMMRQWALSSGGRRAIEMESEKRRGESLVEVRGQRRRVAVLKQRQQAAEEAARNSAREVNQLRDKAQALKASNAFDQDAADTKEKSEANFKVRTAELKHSNERLARGQVRYGRLHLLLADLVAELTILLMRLPLIAVSQRKLNMLEVRGRRPLSYWRLAVFKSLEKKQRRKALNLVLEKNRRKAYRNGWRRAWDGDNGEDYEGWVMDMLKLRGSLATKLLRGADPKLEDPEGWGGGTGAAVTDRVRIIHERTKRGARSVFALDQDGSDMMKDVLGTMLTLRLRQEKQRRRDAGIEVSSSDEDEAQAKASAAAEAEASKADDAELEELDEDAVAMSSVAARTKSRLVLMGVVLADDKRQRNKQLQDLAAKSGRTPEDLLAEAEADAATRYEAAAQEMTAAAKPSASRRPGEKPVEALARKKQSEKLRSGSVPRHPAAGYVADGLDEPDEAERFIGGDTEPASVKGEGKKGVGGGRSIGKRLADAFGLKRDYGDVKAAAVKAVGEAGGDDEEDVESGAGGIPGDGVGAAANAAERRPASATASDTRAARAQRGGGRPTTASTKPKSGGVAIHGEMEKTLAKAAASADAIIQEAAKAAVRGDISQEEAMRIAFNASSTVGVHAGVERDGGELGNQVEDDLRAMGVITGRIMAQRRYSFASESSVEYDGKEADLDEAEREREARVLRVRQASANAAAARAASSAATPEIESQQ
jgi:hypothetical protein